MPARNGARSGRVRAGGVGAATVALVLAMIGCTRSHYRARADRDVYDIQDERAIDPRWRVPRRPVEADPRSRIGDPHDPDREPIPLDDGAARAFQATNGRHREFHKWERRGVTDVENEGWRLCVGTDDNGAVVLDRESVIRLALLNSRDYQLQVEQLYETALQLTLARYEFYLQPFARQTTFFNQLGGGKNELNQLQLNQGTGFTQNFASGGQLLVDFANAMVFNFNGNGVSAVTSNLGLTFTQPLLRGAFARFRTQALSLQERQTLYALRNFARFRRTFYVNVVAGNGYLGLLESVQNIRNQEQNLRTLARNLEEQNELLRAGAVAQKDRDFVAQQYQSNQVSLVGLQANLETQLDLYKFQLLGLPTEMPVRLDDSPLKIFELSNPKIDALRQANERLFLALLQPEVAPPRDELIRTAAVLRAEFDELEPIYREVESELSRWRARLNLVGPDGEELPLPPRPPEDPALARQVELAERVRAGLADARTLLKADLADLALLSAQLETMDPGLTERFGDTPFVGQFVARMPGADPVETWSRLRDLVGNEFNGRVADVLVAQTQARVFLIDLPEVPLSSEDAVRLGLENRLDLMNDRARVTDAWRNEEVAANRLLADLNIVYNGNLGTDPKHDGVFRFDASNSNHRIGIQFDAPLIRRAERNAYRTSQISYQQARRAWINTRDEVVRELRLDVRQLNLNRRQFEIGREQLVTAARRVEEAESEQRNKRTLESSNTILLLQALQSLVDAKNGLISNWVNYQTSRMAIFRDLDLMDIDERGAWVNEHDDIARGAGGAGGAQPGPAATSGASGPAPR